MLQKKKHMPFATMRQMAACMAAVVVLYLVFLFHSLQRHQEKVQLFRESATKGMKQQPASSSSTSSSSCPLRNYPPHRYYHLNAQEQPKFLKEDAIYVFGEWPILLQPSRKSPLSASAKLCVDQSEWLGATNNQPETSLPFADGTNPSIINLERLSRHSMYSYLRNELGGTYLATLCMTNSQCAWRDSEEDVRKYNISKLTAPVTVRTMLLVLDERFQTLAQATIHLDLDAAYSRMKPAKDKAKQRVLLALDDARLFLHHDRLWVSYREGKLFGYDKQVLNEIHITKVGAAGKSFEATIKASQTATLCCGRNMALMEHSTGKTDTLPQLQSLTWVDPITVVNVDDGRQKAAVSQQRRRRLSRKDKHANGPKKIKSHIHGTNAFMVYLEDTHEYLGLGHFHRPADRDPNQYARFGHHYTHTLFTISGSAPYRLQRISPEFVLPASYDKTDGEIIQFASGLEMAYHDPKLLVMAYGINDCEGAAMYVDLDYINSLLRPVEEGKEVVDLTKPLN